MNISYVIVDEEFYNDINKLYELNSNKLKKLKEKICKHLDIFKISTNENIKLYVKDYKFSHKIVIYHSTDVITLSLSKKYNNIYTLWFNSIRDFE